MIALRLRQPVTNFATWFASRGFCCILSAVMKLQRLQYLRTSRTSSELSPDWFADQVYGLVLATVLVDVQHVLLLLFEHVSLGPGLLKLTKLLLSHPKVNTEVIILTLGLSQTLTVHSRNSIKQIVDFRLECCFNVWWLSVLSVLFAGANLVVCTCCLAKLWFSTDSTCTRNRTSRSVVFLFRRRVEHVSH